jgi:hypothetical protein
MLAIRFCGASSISRCDGCGSGWHGRSPKAGGSERAIAGPHRLRSCRAGRKHSARRQPVCVRAGCSRDAGLASSQRLRWHHGSSESARACPDHLCQFTVRPLQSNHADRRHDGHFRFTPSFRQSYHSAIDRDADCGKRAPGRENPALDTGRGSWSDRHLGSGQGSSMLQLSLKGLLAPQRYR